jgi:AcrR family transcriptional regulator
MTMRHDSGRQRRQGRTRLKPNERRRLIVEAAFKAIAQEGFEGLRTRDIAASIGINSATLHHYFETKQDLIEGVSEHLERRLRTERAPPMPRGGPTEIDPFAGQFDDLAFYQSEAPELLAVYREFVARAPRDPAIHALVCKLHASWKAGIVAALAQAQAQSVLRADIDLDAAAGLILSTAWGLIARIFASTADLQAAAAQLRLLMRPVTRRPDPDSRGGSHEHREDNADPAGSRR